MSEHPRSLLIEKTIPETIAAPNLPPVTPPVPAIRRAIMAEEREK